MGSVQNASCFILLQPTPSSLRLGGLLAYITITIVLKFQKAGHVLFSNRKKIQKLTANRPTVC